MKQQLTLKTSTSQYYEFIKFLNQGGTGQPIAEVLIELIAGNKPELLELYLNKAETAAKLSDFFQIGKTLPYSYYDKKYKTGYITQTDPLRVKNVCVMQEGNYATERWYSMEELESVQKEVSKMVEETPLEDTAPEV